MAAYFLPQGLLRFLVVSRMVLFKTTATRVKSGEKPMKLEDWMKEGGISQTKAAALFDATQATISRILRKEGFPSPAMMSRIAFATNGLVRPDDFFDDLPGPPAVYRPVTVRVSFTGAAFVDALATAA
jgi:hypothetical protein